MPLQDLEEFRAIAQGFQALVATVGFIVAGLWAYYRFVRGRTLTPKVELHLTRSFARDDTTHVFASLELRIQNIGAVALRPTACAISISAVQAHENSAVERVLVGPVDLLRWPRDGHEGGHYIDPGESSYRLKVFLLPRDLFLALATVTLNYNGNRVTQRRFALTNSVGPIGLPESCLAAETASPNPALQRTADAAAERQ